MSPLMHTVLTYVGVAVVSFAGGFVFGRLTPGEIKSIKEELAAAKVDLESLKTGDFAKAKADLEELKKKLP